MNYERIAAKSFMETTDRETDITLEHSTPEELKIQDHLNDYYHDQSKIDDRLMQLDKELDIETYLETECAALSVAGIILALTKNKKWLVLPLATSLLVLVNVARGSGR